MAKPSDYSPGGQVYDRTTGTWAGENQGTFGNGYTGDGVGRGTLVIHDANGPVGVHLTSRPTLAAGPAAGVTSNGVKQPGVVSVGAAVAGPGAPAVAASPQAKATAGNRGVFLDQKGVALGFDEPSPVMPIFVGGRAVAHDTGWSNAADGEERWGENELLSPSWFHAWGVAGADVWANASVTSGGPLYTDRIVAGVKAAPAALANGALQRMDAFTLQQFVNTAASNAGQPVYSTGGVTRFQPRPPELQQQVVPSWMWNSLGER